MVNTKWVIDIPRPTVGDRKLELAVLHFAYNRLIAWRSNSHVVMTVALQPIVASPIRARAGDSQTHSTLWLIQEAVLKVTPLNGRHNSIKLICRASGARDSRLFSSRFTIALYRRILGNLGI